MRVEDFKAVIAEFLNSEIPKTTDRETRLPLDTNYVITLTGGRRVGKTYILYNTMSRLVAEGKASKDEIVYMDFEHPRLRNLSAVDLDDMLTAFYELTGKKPRYLFLDEIQTVKDYGSWFRRRLDAKVFLTGSSSALTPPRIAEELRGRSLNFEVFPLSFREYLSFLGVNVNTEIAFYTEEKGRILSLLREYLRYGGYPAVVLERDPGLKKMLLRSYFDSVVVRDLNERYAETFASYIVSNYSSLISYNRVYNYLKTLGFKASKEKVIELFRRGEEAYFLFEVEVFERSETKRKVNPRKVYIVDTGYPYALGYDSVSKAMENAVYLQLRREGKEVYYWRSEDAEVDFVVTEKMEPRELIQVTYAEDKVEEREVKALRRAEREINAERSTIITWSYHGRVNGYQAVPLWYWLLRGEK